MVEALDEQFPLQEIHENDTFDAIRWRAAQRSVVLFLKRMSEEQTNNFELER
tara:strand:- start:683 stop:838 length:156 start_codon:yes stop_codon:yes gene_type:complete